MKTSAHLPLVLSVLLASLAVLGCRPADPLDSAKPLGHSERGFDVHWPVEDPESPLPPSAQALLKGTLTLDALKAADGAAAVRLSVLLTRPSGEPDREYWNETLAYSHLRWMDEVRFWDADNKWLWPNLPYLLRLPGKERVERYGGMDPSKLVDNDFAAVLIRKCDASGAEEPDTKDRPLVSAEWYPVGAEKVDLHTIVHAARSDEFLLHPDNAALRGRFKVWLIYADFLGARTPPRWPEKKEFAGGILAYFEIDWKSDPSGAVRSTVRLKRPLADTGFDWEDWVHRAPGADRSEAESRLSDEP